MKKIITLFLIAGLFVMAAVPALAARLYPSDRIIPINPRIIEKVYRLAHDGDPAGAPVPDTPTPPTQMTTEPTPPTEPTTDASPDFSAIGERLFLVLLVAALFGLGLMVSRRNKKSKEQD